MCSTVLYACISLLISRAAEGKSSPTLTVLAVQFQSHPLCSGSLRAALWQLWGLHGCSGMIWEQYQGSQQGTVLSNHILPWFLGPLRSKLSFHCQKPWPSHQENNPALNPTFHQGLLILKASSLHVFAWISRCSSPVILTDFYCHICALFVTKWRTEPSRAVCWV